MVNTELNAIFRIDYYINYVFMKSLALWKESVSGNINEIPQAEIHFNLWKLPTKKKSEFERFLDIGLLLDDISDIKKLHIYYPAKIFIDDVEDLVGKIVTSRDNRLINTLFNANYHFHSAPNSDYYRISDATGERFSLYELKPESNIQVEEINHGSRITICFRGTKPTKAYIRVRINHDYTTLFSHIDTPSNAIFQSAFSRTEIIDFRINEARELSNELLEVIEDEGLRYHFNKIHFFFICSSREEYLFSHIPFISARQLEKNRWKNYLGNKYNSQEAILAYHWKEKSKEGEKSIEDFNALIKTKYENNSWRTIAKYLIILLLFTIAFNLLSNCVYDCFTNNGNTPVEEVNTSNNCGTGGNNQVELQKPEYENGNY